MITLAAFVCGFAAGLWLYRLIMTITLNSTVYSACDYCQWHTQ